MTDHGGQALDEVAQIVHRAGVHGRCHVAWERLSEDERRSRIETAALVIAAIGADT